MSFFSRRLAFGLALLVVIGLIVGGCAPTNPTGSSPSSPSISVTPTAFTQTYTATDALGTTITLTAPPQRIVSLAPSATEIVYSLGAFTRLVAATTADDFPPEVSKLEKVGDTNNPSLEKILSLRPDLVIAAFGVPLTLVENLNKQNVPVFSLNPLTVDDVLNDMRKVGDLIGNRDQAEKQTAAIQKTIDELKQKRSTTTATSPTVYLEMWPQEPYYTFGPGTYGNDLIEMAGGTNIGAETGEAYPVLSPDYIVFENPDAIVLAYMTQTASGPNPKDRNGWSQISAVIKNHILQVKDPNVYLRPGPRINQALEELSHFLHPEWFK